MPSIFWGLIVIEFAFLILFSSFIGELDIAKIPPIEPFKNLYILDTTFYYPEDRGINESLKCGIDLANHIVKKAAI